MATIKLHQRASRNGANDTTIRATVETITPERAAQMLEGNIVNRTLRRQRVALYAKQMRLGQWRVTGETIVFSPAGQLLQGQHRLTACVESGCSFSTVVVYGVDPEAMKVMDTGLARTAADVFKIEGISTSTWVAAATRQAIAVKGGFQNDTHRMSLITRDELLEFYNEHGPLIAAAGDLSSPVYGALRHSRAAWATLAFLLLDADPELAVEFFRCLGTGADMSEGDPRLALRQFCLNATAQRRRLSWTEMVANGIRVWNSWLDGKQVTHIKGWKPVMAWPEINS